MASQSGRSVIDVVLGTFRDTRALLSRFQTPSNVCITGTSLFPQFTAQTILVVIQHPKVAAQSDNFAFILCIVEDVNNLVEKAELIPEAMLLLDL